MRVNGTLVEDKMRRFKGECEHFSFNKCPIYTHDGTSAKFSNNSQEMDNNAYKRNFELKKSSLSLSFFLNAWSKDDFVKAKAFVQNSKRSKN